MSFDPNTAREDPPPPPDFGDRRVKLSGRHAKTGQEIEVEMPAAKAHAMLTSKQEKLKAILDRLNPPSQ